MRINKNISLWQIWMISFLYTAAVACLIQFVLLPYIFPQFHYKDGLLRDGDWLYFNSIAAELCSKIKSEGWSAWTLRPGGIGQSISGIAGAIYALTVPKPWTLIPLNAAMHATSAVLLLLIMEIFTTRKIAFFSVIPFLLYPSAVIWYASVHKDGFFITGAFAYLYGFLLIVSTLYDNTRCWKKNIVGILLSIFGIFMVWVIRPYLVQLMLVLTCITFVFLFAYMLLKLSRKKLPSFVTMIAFILIICVFMFFSSERNIFLAALQRTPINNLSNSEASEIPAISVKLTTESPAAYDYSFKKITGEESIITKSSNEAKSIITETSIKSTVNKVNIVTRLGEFFNAKIFRLLVARHGSLASGGRTLVDTEVQLNTTRDFIQYFPRLMQITFFSPFPSMWFEKVPTVTSTIMRRISAFEMSGVYFFLFFLPWFLWIARRKIEVWVILVLFGGFALNYGFCVPNIGTLYRFRYGFLMTFVALGVIGFTIFLHKIKQISNRKNA